jgi:hypothetical protein
VLVIPARAQDPVVVEQVDVDDLRHRHHRAERRHRADVEHREVALQLLLGRQPQVAGGAEQLARPVQVEPVGGGEDRHPVAAAVVQRQGLGRLARLGARRPGLGSGAERGAVLDDFVADPLAL